MDPDEVGPVAVLAACMSTCCRSGTTGVSVSTGDGCIAVGRMDIDGEMHMTDQKGRLGLLSRLWIGGANHDVPTSTRLSPARIDHRATCHHSVPCSLHNLPMHNCGLQKNIKDTILFLNRLFSRAYLRFRSKYGCRISTQCLALRCPMLQHPRPYGLKHPVKIWQVEGEWDKGFGESY